jgi:hypothetical protein
MKFSKSAKRSSFRGKMAVGFVAACMGVLGLTSVASAAPKGEFAPFAQCPLSNPKTFNCFVSISSGGTFTVGTKSVPLVNPVTLQGGLELLEEAPFGEEFKFIAAANGDTLSKTPQPVPGGLLGITAPAWWPKILRDLFNDVVINQGFTGVTSTVELAKPASDIKVSPSFYLEQKGIALALPVKVKLSNPFLGSNCYIGSNSNPINLKFTTGTTAPPAPNKPITGNPGTFGANEAFTLLTFSGGRVVDNSFAAPGASGCGGILFSWAVDPLVDSILGTPSAAGKNTAILEGKQLIGSAAAAKASE